LYEEMMSVNGGCGGGDGKVHICGITFEYVYIDLSKPEPKPEKEKAPSKWSLSPEEEKKLNGNEAAAAWDAYSWEQSGGYLNGPAR